MNAFLITVFIFAFTVVFSIAAILSSPDLRVTIASHWKPVLFFVLLNFALKFPFHSAFFHGREYEDCFVHQAVARQLDQLPTNDPAINPFRESIFSIGNINSGDYSQTFYNYIGYPTTIHLLDRLWGERPATAHVVSLLAACLTVALIFFLASLLDINYALPFVATTVYTSLPLGNVFAATTSADVLSSFYITLVLLQIYLLARNRESSFQTAVTFTALSSCLIFSVLVKRENILLLAMLPFCYYFAQHQIGQPRRSVWHSFNTILIAAGPVIAFALIFLDLHSAVNEESGASGHNMFSLRNLLVLGPAYILSLGQFHFYLLFGLMLLALPIVWFRFPISRSIIIVFFAYLFMYSAHYRGYYYLLTYKASAWDTVRYMLNQLPAVALLSGVCIVLPLSYCPGFFRRPRVKLCSVGFAIVAICVSIELSIPMRQELTRSEQRELIQPVLATIKSLYSADKGDPWIFTYQPCLYQIYGPRTLNIVDLALVTRYDKRQLDDILSQGSAYACLTQWDEEPVNKTRYDEQTNWLSQSMSQEVTVVEGVTITKLKAN